METPMADFTIESLIARGILSRGSLLDCLEQLMLEHSKGKLSSSELDLQLGENSVLARTLRQEDAGDKRLQGCLCAISAWHQRWTAAVKSGEGPRNRIPEEHPALRGIRSTRERATNAVLDRVEILLKTYCPQQKDLF